MKATILLVDDSPTEAKTVTGILETEGYRVEWANNAKQGIDMAREIIPNLIIMDVVMPGMNGFQATRRISRDSELKHIPVLILTTKDQQADIIWGHKQGAKAYIVKPPVPEELLQEIQTLLTA